MVDYRTCAADTSMTNDCRSATVVHVIESADMLKKSSEYTGKKNQQHCDGHSSSHKLTSGKMILFNIFTVMTPEEGEIAQKSEWCIKQLCNPHRDENS
jgi:hypothetical protein